MPLFRLPRILRPALVALAGVIALAGCVTDQNQLAQARINTSARECRDLQDRSAACFFRNSPVRLENRIVRLPGRSLDFRRTTAPLEFVDGAGRQWVAPRQTLTDGASIPDVFIQIVGDPNSRDFVNAATVHDAYCGIGNEEGAVYHSQPWQDVHRVFYDSLIVSGTEPLRAKIMFAAVWLAGPRWDHIRRQETRATSPLPAAVLKAGMREAKQYIERSDPSMPQLIGYLHWLEWDMTRRAYRGGSKPGPQIADPNND